MLIYEVNLVVNREVAKDFEAWLKAHIPEVVACGSFTEAKWFERNPADEGIKNENKVFWTIHYYVKDRETLNNYLENHAPRLRKEGLERFPNQFTATRRILELKRL